MTSIPQSTRPRNIIPLSRPRLERERDAEGWLVLLPSGHAWVCGDRRQALREFTELRPHRAVEARMTRRRLPDRRLCLSITLEKNGQHFIASYGFFADGALAEVFLNNSKSGNDIDTSARDAAIATSFALQNGADLDALRKALSRNSNGAAAGVLGAALDLIASERVIEKATDIEGDMP
jgi:hypothetical protein